MTPAELADEMRRLSTSLDDAIGFMFRQVQDLAHAENVYRKARAQAWIGLPDGTAKQKEDAVNALTADARQVRDLADGMRNFALEGIRSRRTQISALQTLAGSMKAEAEFSRTGPM